MPVGRLAALATLPDETWARLEHAPAWAVSYALGETVTDEEAYRRDVETLAAHLGQWAGPHALRAAQSEIIHIDGPNPDRLGTLLRTWPSPHVDPPLAVAATLEHCGYTNLETEQWGAAWTLKPDPKTRGRVDVGELIDQIPHSAEALFEQPTAEGSSRALRYADCVARPRKRRASCSSGHPNTGRGARI